MELQLNHTAKETIKAFGCHKEDMEKKVFEVIQAFLSDGEDKKLSKLGDLIQEKLTDNEILLLATHQLYETYLSPEVMAEAFLDYLKKNN
jgi:hypothetical protein